MIAPPGIELPYTPADRAEAIRLEHQIHTQTWRADHTETSHLSPWEAGMWGILAEKALAAYLGVGHVYELTGSHPTADLISPTGQYRYEVRGTPWKYRKAWQTGQWRTFVYPREVADPKLIIARTDTFLAGGKIWLTGWLRAAEAAQYPIDPGHHLHRHAVPGPGPLRPPETMPRERQEIAVTVSTPPKLGPWAQCARCHRKYRPGNPAQLCYDCTHGIPHD